MSEQTNGPDDLQQTPSFVGGAFGVTKRELEQDAEQDPVAAFQEIEDAEDTGPDIIGGPDGVPSHLQDDVSETAGSGQPSDVEGTSTEPAPGERNEPV